MKQPALLLSATILLKLLLFALLWCLPTTFKPLSMLPFWGCNMLLAMLLALPWVCLRGCRMPRAAAWMQTLFLLIVDCWLVAILMYFRTYYTAIPLTSYALVGNLADFTSSVTDSMRWVDLAFPATTALSAVVCFKGVKVDVAKRAQTVWIATLGGVALFAAIPMAISSGFMSSYAKVRSNAYTGSSCPAVFTPAGQLLYEYLSTSPTPTDADRALVDAYLRSRPEFVGLHDSVAPRRNCVVILCESLESWVIGATVEGQVLTPNLNRLVAEEGTLYAPRMLTQVGGGRSIDAQLMLSTGLLPIENGAYSALYAGNTYPSVQKAMKEILGARAELLTIDKISTWNQGEVARAFGIDTIVAYSDFEMTDGFGTHKRLGDQPFLQQAAEKIARGEVWADASRPEWLQLVTYSGHAPFNLPERLRQVHFSDTIPQKMADYMATANYTDAAIGAFVDFLRTLPRYTETLVVITGDHEGLADYRRGLLETPAGRRWIDAGCHTPFIVLNAPVAGRIDDEIGQVDMYPTLLGLLGLDAYSWKGLGVSLIDPSPRRPIPPEAHQAADRIIRYDMLAE